MNDRAVIRGLIRQGAQINIIGDSLAAGAGSSDLSLIHIYTKDSYIRKNYHQLYRSYAVRRYAELKKELNLEKTPEELSRIYTRYYKEERIPEPKAEEVCRRLSQYYTCLLYTSRCV